MNPTSQVLVHNLGNGIVFYKKVKESKKSVWLQKVGSEVKNRPSNSEYSWEVMPKVNETHGDVFRKLKTPNGRVKMSEYNFLTVYDERNSYTESNF